MYLNSWINEYVQAYNLEGARLTIQYVAGTRVGMHRGHTFLRDGHETTCRIGQESRSYYSRLRRMLSSNLREKHIWGWVATGQVDQLIKNMYNYYCLNSFSKIKAWDLSHLPGRFHRYPGRILLYSETAAWRRRKRMLVTWGSASEQERHCRSILSYLTSS